MLRSLFLATALVAPTLLPVAARADDTRTLQTVRASRVLYDAGVAARDPLLILAAAKLRRSVGLVPGERTPDGGTPGGSAIRWTDMLEAAREAAAGDELMQGLIEDVEAENSKGVTNGPVYNIASLGAKGSDTYRGVPFDGREYAEVYVEAKGNQDLNIHIYDSQNRLVCSDTDASAIAYCGWRPREDGTFTVKVSNASGSGAQYSLMTN